MAEYASAVSATMAILRADTDVVAHVGDADRVYGGELPADQVAAMPARGIVVAAAGNAPEGPGSRDYVPVSRRRVDVRCYGRTLHETDGLAEACVAALKRWRCGVADRAMVHWFHHTAGPVSYRDADGDWPVSVVTFTVSLVDELLPAVT